MKKLTTTSPRQWYRMESKGAGHGEILIYDDIGGGFFSDGVTAKQFAKDLKALGKIDQLDVHINSPGGDVFAGVGIYNQIRAHTAEKTVFVDGLAASIASVIAMAGDKVVMAENALMMIHDPSGFTMGTAADMRKTAEALDKIKTSLITSYTRKTGMDAEAVSLLMAEETWMTAAEAIENGFADEMTDALDVAASSRMDLQAVAERYHFRHAPKCSSVPVAMPVTPMAMPVERVEPNEEVAMDITMDGIRKDHAGIAAAFVAEGQAGGIKAERERVAGIHAAFVAVWGAAAQAIEMTVRDGFIALGISKDDAELEFKKRKLAQLTDAAPISAGGSEGAEPKTVDLSALPIEDRCKAEWDGNVKSVRAEFLSLGSYLAYCKAETAGHVKILSK